MNSQKAQKKFFYNCNFIENLCWLESFTNLLICVLILLQENEIETKKWQSLISLIQESMILQNENTSLHLLNPLKMLCHALLLGFWFK